MSSSPTTTGTQIPRIKALDESVVARIAAGEVIHRPANAIKELLENSLDAGSTAISIVVKDGGMKLLQIQDDGHGILSDDLPLVCCRHTTSKINKVEDLKEIRTFGFRGEALASISRIAHVKITSFPKTQKCAFQLNFENGEPKNPNAKPGEKPKPGEIVKPKPCAAKPGTLIMIEDLFYNISTRRKAITNTSDEYNRILHIIKRYAIINSQVSFTCKKFNESIPDIHTPGKSTPWENIKLLFGEPIANVLVPISIDESNQKTALKLEGLISKPEYDGSETVFILFINNRLVNCKSLKKAIEAAYASVRNSKIHPFIYANVQLPTHNVDVNVHPTKEEVNFLHESDICQLVSTFIIEMFNQKSPPISSTAPPSTQPIFSPSQAKTSQAQASQKAGKQLTLDANFGIQSPVKASSAPPSTSKRKDSPTSSQNQKRRRLKPPCDLTSVVNLVHEIEANCNEGNSILFLKSNLLELMDMIGMHKYVGLIDKHTSLIKYKDTFCAINNYNLSKELIYQLVISNFNSFSRIRLNPPLPIFDLVRTVLDNPISGWTPDDGDKDQIASAIVELLIERARMLEEYFAIEISRTGCIAALPVIIKSYLPPMGALPLFLFGLSTKVEFSAEQQCFQSIARELAEFYAIRPPTDPKLMEVPQKISSTPDSGSIAPSQSSPDTPVDFAKQNKDDHPLQRALEFCERNKLFYLFAKEYSDGSNNISGARKYIAQNVESFFQSYIQLDPKDRIFDDVIREGTPIKFFADLEFDPSLSENANKENEVKEMITILKHYIEIQWDMDMRTSFPNDSWMEFDASRAGKRVSRHLHNDQIIFSEIQHLHTFMKRLQTTIYLDIQKGIAEASKLVVWREKSGKKKKELFFDMLVYTKNRCFRIPWSTKSKEYRHLYPVVDDVVRRDMTTPHLETISRVLCSYWKGGSTPHEPFSYPQELLDNRQTGKSPKKTTSDKSPFQKQVERFLFTNCRQSLYPPVSLVTDNTISKMKIPNSILSSKCLPQSENDGKMEE